MRADLRIRRAEPAEASALTDLAMRSKALWGYDAAFMAMCLEELTVQPAAIEAGEVWVAEEGGAIVGMLGLIPEPDTEDRLVEVHMIFVEPNRVRSGVGRALWNHAEERARALGGEALGLDADPNAVPFYESMGMRVIGRSPSGSIPGRTLPRMAKSLAADKPSRVA